jgi:hypothetical protein
VDGEAAGGIYSINVRYNRKTRSRTIKAGEKLLAAAQLLAKQPQAMQSRYLQTLVATDNSNTMVFPVPMDPLAPLLTPKGQAASS